MLSSKKIYGIFILFLLLLNSCGEKKQVPNLAELNKSYNNPSFVLGEAKAILGNDVKQTYKGRFDQDSVIEIVAGTEVANSSDWGIRFNLLKLNNGILTKVWQTELLPGSFKGSLCDKIKFPAFDHELMYYNSKDFYIGSGGGEVFAYIINFQNHKTYQAHLIAEGKTVSLYISDNIDVPEIHNFFFAIFRKDYPQLKIIDKDIHLKY